MPDPGPGRTNACVRLRCCHGRRALAGPIRRQASRDPVAHTAARVAGLFPGHLPRLRDSSPAGQPAPGRIQRPLRRRATRHHVLLEVDMTGRRHRRLDGLASAPTVDDIDPGAVFYQFYGPPRDDWGRRSWFAYWQAPALADVLAGHNDGELMVRGQVFFADDREHMQEDLRRGLRVFLWPSRQEVTATALAGGTPS
jgi:hypothetical protein